MNAIIWRQTNQMSMFTMVVNVCRALSNITQIPRVEVYWTYVQRKIKNLAYIL